VSLFFEVRTDAFMPKGITMPPNRSVVLPTAQLTVECPRCGLKAVVEASRMVALLERWSIEHELREREGGSK
jgi:hypothetical protein